MDYLKEEDVPPCVYEPPAWNLTETNGKQTTESSTGAGGGDVDAGSEA